MNPYLRHARLCGSIDGESKRTERCLPISTLIFSINLVGVLNRVHVKFNLCIKGRSNERERIRKSIVEWLCRVYRTLLSDGIKRPQE